MVSIDELVLEDFCLLVPINIQPLDFSVRQLAREEVNMCVGRLVNYTELQIEIEKAKPTGDLDLVFSKYCRYVLPTLCGRY
jgi:Protein of unknown function (DUF1397).